MDARLFSNLKTDWQFLPTFTNDEAERKEACNLGFRIDFEFNSYLYAYVANHFFLEVATKMVQAFENRCHVLYGNDDQSDGD